MRSDIRLNCKENQGSNRRFCCRIRFRLWEFRCSVDVGIEESGKEKKGINCTSDYFWANKTKRTNNFASVGKRYEIGAYIKDLRKN